jgi:hypothetical protein
MKKIFFSLLIALPYFVIGQNSIDALRYSRINYQGTARFNALGGSMGAVGGDASSIIVNPAAIGVYRNSEFTFSTNFVLNKNRTNYLDTYREDLKVSFNLGNIAYVGAYKGDPNGWKNYSFAIGHNTLNNFNSQSKLSGINANSSKIDDYVNILNENGATTASVASYSYLNGPSESYWIYLIDSIGQNQHQRFLDFQDNIQQSSRTETSGRHGETFFSFGGNYQDRLYLGAVAGVQNIRFEQTTFFNETYLYSPPPQSNEFLATEFEEETNLITSGNGLNLKIGAIYRITNTLRVGASFHSPTILWMTETFSYKSNSSFSNGDSFDSGESLTNFDYRLITPARLNASLAYIYKKKALINIDYEYVNYSNARLSDKKDFEFDYSEINSDIERDLTSTHNIRAGIEYRIEPLVFRAGIRLEEDPNVKNILKNQEGPIKSYSLGSGFRSKNYNIDFTYVRTDSRIVDPVYNSAIASSDTESITNNYMITVGWKW